MSNEIIININGANKAQRYQKKEELFQIEAFEDVSKILYEHNVSGNLNDITECRFHDAIFIDGDRGVGKTAFMVNIERYYNKHFEIKNKPKYIFLKSVDPTLLEHTEKFLGVVFGKIVEMVSKRLKNNCINEDEYYIDGNCDKKYMNENLSKNCIDGYYNALENLSKSLSAVSSLENKEDAGIEEISSYKSSQKLEQYSHEFFQIVSKMFNVDAIVILIDDVDMAFDKGFDVLEVVRKYLASPYLIPIVAGDMKLYREIVETKFMDKIDFNKDISAYSQMKKIFEKGCSTEKEINKNWDNNMLDCDHKLLIQNREDLKEKKNLIDNIVKQYLEKLFPNEYHIKLKDIFSILKEKEVQIKFPNNLIVPYTEVKDFEIRHINLGINQVKFTYQIFSNNTRDLIQYLYSKKDIYIYFFTNLNSEYSKVSNHKKYIPQEVISKYDIPIMYMILNENELYKKSLEITSKVYEYGDIKQKELSRLADNDVKAYQSGRYHIYNAFLGNIFEKTKLSIEKGKEPFSIYYRDFGKVESFEHKDKYIVDLFVHSNYYNTENKTKNYIFAGSFIELMFFSFTSNMKLERIQGSNYTRILNFNEDISINENLNMQFNEIKKCYDFSMVDTKEVPRTLDNISYKIPFNSIFKKNKNFETGSGNVDEEEVSSSIYHDNVFLEELAIDILVWRNAFLDDIKINSISIYEIMHKFFNNFNILKNQKLLDETPLSFIKRILFIFINSVAFFENTNIRVAQTNIALSQKFDMEILLTKTNAFNQNIKPLLNQKSLTRALFYHPIISYILSSDENSDIGKLSFVNFEPNKKIKNSFNNIVKSDINFNKFNNTYNDYFTESGKYYNLDETRNYIPYLHEIISLFEKTNIIVKREIRLKFSKNKYARLYKKIKSFYDNFNQNDKVIVDKYESLIINDSNV